MFGVRSGPRLPLTLCRFAATSSMMMSRTFSGLAGRTFGARRERRRQDQHGHRNNPVHCVGPRKF